VLKLRLTRKEPRLLIEHRAALNLTDVAQVDVNRETSQIKIEEVDRCAALQHEPCIQKRMAMEFKQRLLQADRLLQIRGSNPEVLAISLMYVASSLTVVWNLPRCGRAFQEPSNPKS